MTIDEQDDRDDAVAAQDPQYALFAVTSGRTKGYERRAVDAFMAQARAAFESEEHADRAPEQGGTDAATTGADENSGTTTLFRAELVRRVAFPLVRHGYAIAAVDAALSRIEDAFAALERERVVTAVGPAEWVGATRATAQVVLDRLSRPRGQRFEKVGVMRYGYRVDEVDLVADKIARYLAAGETVTVEQVRAVAFRMQRGGYREAQVDAVLDSVVEVMLAVA
ncbi:DivIVA domain-containing protein [Microbacterium sp. P01]|uniref:DivIVA domain-containing protein n=1 Tax=unclassified Microbacterium TaxID=2609290 RepID=UPI00366D8707